MSLRPHLYHQFASDGIVSAINVFARPRGIGQAVSAPGLIFDPENDVVPDVAYTSTARLLHILSDGKLHAAPDLVAEILSPGKRNIARDRETKRKLYSRYGVREYWIVDWLTRSIELYRRDDGQLVLVATLYAGDTLLSPLLPGFSLSLSELFAEIPAGATYTDDDD